MAAVLIALAITLRPVEEAFLRRHIHEKLETLPDDQVTDLLADLAGFGDVGLATLIEALGSNRPAVANQAHQALLGAIDEWESLASRQFAPKLATLANLLADRAEHFGSAARGLATDVAHRILLCSFEDLSIDRARVIADCRRVVPATGASGNIPFTAMRTEGMEAVEPLVRDTHPIADDGTHDAMSRSETDPPVFPAAHASMESAGAATGGNSSSSMGQDSGEFSSTTRSQRAQHPGRAVNNADEPSGEASPMPPEPLRLSFDEDTKPIPRLRFQDRPHRKQEDPLRDVGRALPEASGESPEKPLDESDVLTIMRRLHDPSPRMVAAAEAELASLGFGSAEMELARAVTDADAKVRRDCVDRLGTIPNLNAKPWLLWLSQDQDVLVRLAALTWMATSRDPDLLRVVERTALQDRDPRITALADRLFRKGQVSK
jgi:hypothetical protein